jgi:RAT1-interacting protein
VQALYEDKHRRWWVQSFLAGIPTLVLGGRDVHGTLHKVRGSCHLAA